FNLFDLSFGENEVLKSPTIKNDGPCFRTHSVNLCFLLVGKIFFNDFVEYVFCAFELVFFFFFYSYYSKEVTGVSGGQWGSFLGSLLKGVFWLRNLMYLSINHNQLTVIPPELCSLVNLSELHVNYNQLVCIPKEIKLLKNLQRLFLVRNNIEVLPEGLCHLKKLRILDIAGNVIQIFPACFIYMVYHIDRLLYVEPSLHLWDKAYLVMVDNVFDVFLDLDKGLSIF
ncbi:hypothetical protein STEG23_019488, partial [Scotinomys teguina]